MRARVTAGAPAPRAAARPGASPATWEAPRVPLIERLRAGTRDLHEALEDELGWEARVATRTGYRDLVARWWGVHAGLEPLLDSALAGAAHRAFYAPRRKLPLLRRDLAALGLADGEVAALPVCPDFARAGVVFADPGAPAPAEALGGLYVTEGSTLGGQIMARHLARAHGIGRDDGGAFLAGYAPGEVGPMWRAFRERLAAEQAAEQAVARGADEGPDGRAGHSAGRDDHDATVVRAARATFAVVRGWLTA